MIGGRNKRSDIASARQITASSSDKVQLDPKASNKKKAASGKADGWSLLAETSDRIAQLFNTSYNDLIDAWLWRVWLDRKISECNARSGTEARQDL